MLHSGSGSRHHTIHGALARTVRTQMHTLKTNTQQAQETRTLVQIPSAPNPGGIHYRLSCEQGCRNAASSKWCPIAGTGRAPLPAWCVLLAITAHWITGQWKMPDKHHTGNELPPSTALSLSLSGSLSGLRIALEMEPLILSDTVRVKRSDETFKVRTGK